MTTSTSAILLDLLINACLVVFQPLAPLKLLVYAAFGISVSHLVNVKAVAAARSILMMAGTSVTHPAPLISAFLVPRPYPILNLIQLVLCSLYGISAVHPINVQVDAVAKCSLMTTSTSVTQVDLLISASLVL